MKIGAGAQVNCTCGVRVNGRQKRGEAVDSINSRRPSVLILQTTIHLLSTRFLLMWSQSENLSFVR